MLKVDLHNHSNYIQKRETTFSPKELIDKAAKKGVDVLSFSEHYRMKDTKFEDYRKDPLQTYRDFKDYATKKGILLLPAVEVLYKEGEVLLINFNDNIKKYPKITDIKELPKDVLVVAPHPYFKRDICLGKHLVEHIELFDAIEYSYFYIKFLNLNHKAVKVAEAYQKPMLGSSDCHNLDYFDYTYSFVDAKKNAKDIVNAIKKGKVIVVSKPLPVWLLVKAVFSVFSRIIYFMGYERFKSRS